MGTELIRRLYETWSLADHRPARVHSTNPGVIILHSATGQQNGFFIAIDHPRVTLLHVRAHLLNIHG